VERGETVEEFGRRLGESRDGVDALIAGRTSISIGMARRLAEVVGASVEFWMSRDGQYWDDRNRVEVNAWTRALPLAQMTKLGWIRDATGADTRVARCLEFFGVGDLSEWRSTY